MQRFTRRDMLRRGLAASAVSGLSLGAASRVAGQEAAATDEAEEKPYRFDLPRAGCIAPVPGSKIEASPMSVGFETLDRQHFDPTKTYDHLAGLGAKWARCQTGWCRCEKEKGKYTFEWLDEVVDALLGIGVQPWFNLGYGNPLYTTEADETAVGWAPIFDGDTQQAWLNFTRALAEHFADRVKYWEIWNEPNIRNFWKPNKPNAADYVELVRVTTPVVRKSVPEAVIVGGVYAGVPIDYIRECFEQGMGGMIDRLSYHPYRPMPEANYERDVKAMREIIDAHSPKVRLWQGENGCPSKGGKGSAGALSNLNWNETRQAKWVLRRILCDLRLDVELTSYFHLVDLVGYRGITNYKGLLRGSDYTPKPAFRAYQHLAALFDSQTRHDASLVLDLVDEKKTNLWEAGFTRCGRGLYAYWYPASLLEAWTPRELSVRLPVTPEATIEQPVLIDPLSGAAYRLKPVARSEKELTLRVPLLEYPLLLTDESLVSTS